VSAVIYTPAALAELLDTTEANVLQWRRQYGWPSFKVGKTIRFTQEHVEQIVAKHSAAPVKADQSPAVVIGGQTKRSARRSA